MEKYEVWLIIDDKKFFRDFAKIWIQSKVQRIIETDNLEEAKEIIEELFKKYKNKVLIVLDNNFLEKKNGQILNDAWIELYNFILENYSILIDNIIINSSEPKKFKDMSVECLSSKWNMWELIEWSNSKVV
jgi:response regulator of citrate/malate metabolism